MTVDGSIVPRQTVISLAMAEINTPDAKRQRVIFDNLIRKKHRNSMNLPPQKIEANIKMTAFDCLFVSYKDDEIEPHFMPENDVIDMNISFVDVFVSVKVLLPQGRNLKDMKRAIQFKPKFFVTFVMKMVTSWVMPTFD